MFPRRDETNAQRRPKRSAEHRPACADGYGSNGWITRFNHAVGPQWRLGRWLISIADLGGTTMITAPPSTPAPPVGATARSLRASVPGYARSSRPSGFGSADWRSRDSTRWKELRPHESPGSSTGRPECSCCGPPSGKRTRRRPSYRPGTPGTSPS